MATGKQALVSLIGAGAASIVLWALPKEEGTRYVPYRDIGGVWTVCDGVTGPSVIPGRTYSADECKDMNSIALLSHAKSVVRCINVPMSDQRTAGLILFTYNVGDKAFCSSSLVRRINMNDPAACDEILNNWYRAGGKDCRIRSNNCYGVINRRTLETQLCKGKA